MTVFRTDPVLGPPGPVVSPAQITTGASVGTIASSGSSPLAGVTSKWVQGLNLNVGDMVQVHLPSVVFGGGHKASSMPFVMGNPDLTVLSVTPDGAGGSNVVLEIPAGVAAPVTEIEVMTASWGAVEIDSANMVTMSAPVPKDRLAIVGGIPVNGNDTVMEIGVDAASKTGIAIGSEAESDSGVALGHRSKTASGIAIGPDVETSGGVAAGDHINAKTSVALGSQIDAPDASGVVQGQQITVGAMGASVVLGDSLEASNNSASSRPILLGYNMTTSHMGVIALGSYAQGTTSDIPGNTVVIGKDNTLTYPSPSAQPKTVVVGDGHSVTTGHPNVVVGGLNRTRGDHNVAIGYKVESGVGVDRSMIFGTGGAVKHSESVVFGGAHNPDDTSTGYPTAVPGAYMQTFAQRQFVIGYRDLIVGGPDGTGTQQFGIYLYSPNGTRYRVTVDDAGALQVT